MPVVGKMNVSVEYRAQTKNLDLIVVTGNGPAVLGRSWLDQLCLDWATIGKIAREALLDLQLQTLGLVQGQTWHDLLV